MRPNLLEHLNPRVVSDEDRVLVKPAQSRWILDPAHRRAHAAASAVLPIPEEVRDTTTDVDPWEHLRGIREINQLPHSPIGEHFGAIAVKPPPPSEPSRGRDHEDKSRLEPLCRL